jgi:Zn-dependent peptidase ImmA (M78 family)
MTDVDSIRAKALEIRNKYGMQEPPVNVFDIASNEGIDIVYFNPKDDTSDVSGLFVKDEKRVYLNADEPAERQAFTLAHELAHYFLDHKPDEYGVYKRYSLYSEKKPPREQEADLFAAELLMPRDLIAEVKKRYEVNDRDTLALSKMFGVSRSAMALRLKDLANHYGKP